MYNPLSMHFDTMSNGAYFGRNMCAILVLVGICILVVSHMSRYRLQWGFLCFLTLIGATSVAVALCYMVRMERDIETFTIGEMLANGGCEDEDEVCHVNQALSYQTFVKKGMHEKRA